MFRGLLLLAFSIVTLNVAFGQAPPVIPVGFDAYRQWDQWPLQRVGIRAYMRSTYDRRGNNESADASHFLYQLRDDFNVTLDVQGRGILYFARYNHWHGSPWHYEVDGADHIVQETTTVNPLKPLENAVFMPEAAFPPPLTATYAQTKGADLSWVPIGFEDQFRMAYSRTFYGTGYYIYHLLPQGVPLSRPVESWTPTEKPPADVLDLLNAAGTDIAPRLDTEEGRKLKISEKRGNVQLPAKQARTVATLESASTIRALKLSVPKGQAVDLGHCRLRITFDDRQTPSVDAPVALFFGTGTLYNRDDREFLVKALPVNVRYAGGRCELACYFPMPFFKSARIELVNDGPREFPNIDFVVRSQPLDGPSANVGYFHATYADHPTPQPGRDMVFLDTNSVEGGGPWSGSFVGTSFIFSHRGALGTLEGDPRFFFDDSQTPQAYGTGTEEWGGGGDYWGGRTMTLPLAGHPVGVPRADRKPGVAFERGEENIESAYRFLLADLMPFGRRAVIRLEHGGVNESAEHYESVSYWYGAPRATLELTDTLEIGNAGSESAHRYSSPEASARYTVTSRYELGPDHANIGGDGPKPDPADFADFEFTAAAGRPYAIWLRGRSHEDNLTDATWLQFDSEIGTAHQRWGEKGFGNWRDEAAAGEWAWSSELPQNPPAIVQFEKAGQHTLRLQRRAGPHEIDRVWLSTTQRERPKNDVDPKTSDEVSYDEIVLTPETAFKVAGGVERRRDDGRSLLSVGPRGTGALQEVFPEQTKTGRTTKTFSEFVLKVNDDNWGVLLRRTLDYQFPNQRARVRITDADAVVPEWKDAGVWYLAGSNTCYFSHPGSKGGELGAPNPIVQVSNRRFRDDEFLVSRNLTRGLKAIRVRIEFLPVTIPLLPGRAPDETAWSEIQYSAYSFLWPRE